MEILINLNAVLAANTFNPSVFSPVWLTKHDFLREGELQQDYVFTPSRVQFSTLDTMVIIVPNRAEFTALPCARTESGAPVFDTEKAIASLTAKIRSLLSNLPHTPYAGLGFNFAFIVVPPDGQTVHDMLNRVFYHGDNKFMSAVSEHESTMGGFVLQKWEHASLKIEVKPTQYAFRDGEPLAEGILADFNFHFPASGDQYLETFEKALLLWEKAVKHTSSIIGALVSS